MKVINLVALMVNLDIVYTNLDIIESFLQQMEAFAKVGHLQCDPELTYSMSRIVSVSNQINTLVVHKYLELIKIIMDLSE